MAASLAKRGRLRCERLAKRGQRPQAGPLNIKNVVILTRVQKRKSITQIAPTAAASRQESSNGFGDVADWYDQLVGESGSEYQREVVLPGMLRLLNLQPGDSAVDIACGQGVLRRILQDRGVKMTGVDAAAELIRAARERGPEEIRYIIGDAREFKFLPESSFKAAG